MNPALKRLIEAEAQLTQAQQALDAAQAYRRACALRLSEIENEDER